MKVKDNIKKFIVIMLSLLMALTMFTACGQKEEPQDENASIALGMLTPGQSSEERVETQLNEKGKNAEIVFYDDLNSMLLALQSGKIAGIGRIPLVCAKYIVARNEGFTLYENNKTSISYYMGFAEDNTQTYDLLNDAISAMKEDGTLDQLREEYIDKFTDADAEPPAVEMPHFDGAGTLKIAVTGDVPPLDLVNADGNPAGYNVAVLAEIAERAKINIELVPMNSGSRFTALTSGSVDAIFIVSKASTEGDNYGDCPEGVKLTESFFEDEAAGIFASKSE